MSQYANVPITMRNNTVQTSPNNNTMNMPKPNASAANWHIGILAN